MKVTRFMCRAEWDAYQEGKILLNDTEHFNDGKGSNSKGFCFTQDSPEDAWEYLEGIVDADVWATFEIPYKHLHISVGLYADHSEGAGFDDIVTKAEWWCKSYDKTIAKVVDYCCPFQGEEYRELKKFANEFLNNVKI